MNKRMTDKTYKTGMNANKRSRSLGWKITFILTLIILAITMVTPLDEKIKLGLDLKGGTDLIMAVEIDDALRIQTNQTITELTGYLNESKLKFNGIKRIGTDKIRIHGIARDKETHARELLEKHLPNWSVDFTAGHATVSLSPETRREMTDACVSQCIETVRERVDGYGVREALVRRLSSHGNDRIMVSMPGVDDPKRILELLKSTAMLEFRHREAGPFPTEEAANAHYGGQIPDNLVTVPTNSKRMDAAYHVLTAAPVVTGSDLKKASRGRGEFGESEVHFTLNSTGAEKFKNYTAANIGQYLAIVFDNKVESVAAIQDVLSYNTRITGNYTVEEVDDMVLKLRSGALPASMTPVKKRVIGASLGQASIRQGVTAAIVGLVLVMLFMLIHYRTAGVNSVIALLLNLLLLTAGMAYFDFTLTLPGIAGIILTIGMSVDANVLIFERIKEELKNKKSIGSAINNGFKKAFVTVMDANLTTVIAAVFLLQFGSGPIKGFAVTLITGICSSMFTALFVSRVIFQLVYSSAEKRRKSSSAFKPGIFETLFLPRTTVPFMKKNIRRFAAALSSLIILIGTFTFFTAGFNQGIDFKGGTVMEVAFKTPTSEETVRSGLQKAGLSRAVVQKVGETGERFLIKTLVPKPLTSPTGGKVEPDETGALKRKLADELASKLETAVSNVGQYTVEDLDMVGSSVGDSMKRKTILAATWALIGMLIYIAFRFKPVYGLAAVLTLAHDLLVCLTVLLVFKIEISLPVVAALLTVIGYSLNDTIVIFDRVRENLRLRKSESSSRSITLEKTLNTAINQTLSRTLVTSGTTLAAVLALLFLGGDVLYTFSLTLFVGISVGTYSSIFQSCAWLIPWQKTVMSS